MRGPIVCFDFDGVVNSYKSGWQGPRKIPDEPVEGVFTVMAERPTAPRRVTPTPTPEAPTPRWQNSIVHAPRR